MGGKCQSRNNEEAKLQSTYPHEVQVIESAGAGFRTAQSHHDNADQGCDSEDVRRENTRDATGFTHGELCEGDWANNRVCGRM